MAAAGGRTGARWGPGQRGDAVGILAKRKTQAGLKYSKAQPSSPAWPCILSASVESLTCDAGGG